MIPEKSARVADVNNNSLFISLRSVQKKGGSFSEEPCRSASEPGGPVVGVYVFGELDNACDTFVEFSLIFLHAVVPC